MSNENDRLRPNVCILLYNAERKLLLGERLGEAGHWQFPQGGIDKPDTPERAVVREIYEELGIEEHLLGRIEALNVTHTYLWDTVPDYAVGRWIGQAQTFWSVEFLGADTDIVLERHDAPEFQAWQWCSSFAVEQIAAEKRRDGYKKALRAFEATVERVDSGKS